uniref:Uncharacterized protein n=1 Tax=Rhizophora mucronata TaxID=61149 RepID=A0A2P2NVE3_RHIMU
MSNHAIKTKLMRTKISSDFLIRTKKY